MELAVGASGDEVKNLQQNLAALGYYQGEIGGMYGQYTEEAVRAFQGANNLPATGVLDDATAAALADALLRKSEQVGLNGAIVPVAEAQAVTALPSAEAFGLLPAEEEGAVRITLMGAAPAQQAVVAVAPAPGRVPSWLIWVAVGAIVFFAAKKKP